MAAARGEVIRQANVGHGRGPLQLTEYREWFQ